MNQKRERRGFTLIELMVVILIVGILAAVAVPILRGRIEQAKWSEAAATAGAIKTAVRACFAEAPGSVVAGAVTGQMATLGFQAGDLTGRYFNDTHFTIGAIDAQGNATITVTAGTGLTGTGSLDGTPGGAGWVYTP